MSLTETALADSLREARERTFSLVEALGDDDVHRQHTALMSPLVWDLAHVAAYEDLWLCHRHGGEPLLRGDLAAMYDAFETPRVRRGSLPLLDRAEAVDYLAEVRARALDVLDRVGPGDGTLVELVLRHEQQHNETMLQAIELAGLPWAGGRERGDDPEAPRAPAGDGGLGALLVEGGRAHLGARARDGFSYDNERPAHTAEVAPFRIGRTAITNATFLTFVEGGGYERREWWSDEGWAWKEEYDITHPGDRRWPAGRHPDAPVVHVSWFEADALARAHGARLPTEAEWEKAATWDQETRCALRAVPAAATLDLCALGPRPPGPDTASPSGALGMFGDVWEWTSSPFEGYPGFRPHPYPEYSQVFFGPAHRVLRGGSWATRRRVATLTFRNWDLPVRRQLFAGVRLAWDA
jgi:gamma-glutamyl hercynylcysteine S-oxide synthase